MQFFLFVPTSTVTWLSYKGLEAQAEQALAKFPTPEVEVESRESFSAVSTSSAKQQINYNHSPQTSTSPGSSCPLNPHFHLSQKLCWFQVQRHALCLSKNRSGAKGCFAKRLWSTIQRLHCIPEHLFLLAYRALPGICGSTSPSHCHAACSASSDRSYVSHSSSTSS